MIKRTVIAFALAILPMVAFGQTVDRDVLLTTDGTVFTIESKFATPNDTQIHSNQYLTLTTQKGTDSKTEVVPATTDSGAHIEPSLAYDSETKTLFVFWEAARAGAFTTDLAIAWYRDGQWGKVTKLDGADWSLRSNLRIALTRKTQAQAKDGSAATIPEITVHAVWWEEGRTSQWARYAMITLDHDDVTVDNVENLTDFVANNAPFTDEPSQRELLRHPAIFESSNHDSVDVVFGDPRTDKMHRVTLTPVVQGRLRITIGKDREVPTPTAAINSITNVGAISTNSNNIAYYFTTPDSVKYLLFSNGAWSDLRSVALSDHLTSEAAVSALRRLLSSE